MMLPWAAASLWQYLRGVRETRALIQQSTLIKRMSPTEVNGSLAPVLSALLNRDGWGQRVDL